MTELMPAPVIPAATMTALIAQRRARVLLPGHDPAPVYFADRWWHVAATGGPDYVGAAPELAMMFTALARRWDHAERAVAATVTPSRDGPP